MADITAIILTRNEENYIEDCIKSISGVVKRVIVIDSYSEDRTCQIAKRLGAEIYKHEFINHSLQYQYAEKIAKIDTTWTFRIDADERLKEESAKELDMLCCMNENTDVNGIYLRFCNNFMGRFLKHGGVYPWRKLCVYKTGKGGIENRDMDEHIVIYEGKCIKAKKDSLHYAYRGLNFFINKFNWYSSKEAKAYFDDFKADKSSYSIKTKMKIYVYYRLPMGIRSWLFFVYRYYFCFGFLDGKEGYIYAFLHAYWYRFLIDAKIYEHIKLHNKLDYDKILK